MLRTLLADLEVFTAVARHRSFRRTALELGVSPALVSQTVRRLEQQLGVELFRRTTRSVALTPAGEQLLNPLSPALDEIRNAVEHLNTHRSVPMGRLRINAPAPVAQFLLAPLVADFQRMHPQVEMEIVAEAAKIDIVKDGFDAGVRFDDDLQQDAVAVPIGPPQRYAVVAGPQYLRQHGAPRSPTALKQHPCIRRRFQGGGLFEWVFRRKGRQVLVQPEGPLTVNDSLIAVHAAMAGAGIAYVHEHYVHREVEAGTLVRLLDDWSPGLGQPFLYFPKQRHVPAALRAFIDFARVHRVAAP
ncbi:MAG TPA: LysR family transcriptional regulator [Rhizobacter sp.]